MPFTTICGHTILPPSPGELVLDLGANHGGFSEALAARGAVCHAVEASPHLYSKLREMPNLHAYHYAMGGAVGDRTFYLAANDETSSLKGQGASVTVPGIDLATLVARYQLGHVSLLKIDIEGAEIELLDSTPDALLASIPQITIEFHDFDGTIAATEVTRLSNRLSKLGFQRVAFSLRSGFDVLFLRPSLKKITPVARTLCPLWRRLVK